MKITVDELTDALNEAFNNGRMEAFEQIIEEDEQEEDNLEKIEMLKRRVKHLEHKIEYMKEELIDDLDQYLDYAVSEMTEEILDEEFVSQLRTKYENQVLN